MSSQWDSAADALQWAPWTPWAIVEQRLEVNGNLHDDVDVQVASSASACAARVSTPTAPGPAASVEQLQARIHELEEQLATERSGRRCAGGPQCAPVTSVSW